MTDCRHTNTKIIGQYTLDCGCSGEYRWTRRRCLTCNQIMMEKTRVDEDLPAPPVEPEPAEDKPKKRKRRKS